MGWIDILQKLQNESLSPSELQAVLLEVLRTIEPLYDVARRAEFQQLMAVIESLAKAQELTERKLAQLAETVKGTEECLKELAVAQKRTEERIEELAQAQKRTDERLKELAAAQKRTEERVEELAQAQKRTEERLEELAVAQKRTEERIEELAQAQKRTDERLKELAAAQKRTEERVEELARAQKRTEERLEELAVAQKRTEERIKELAQAQKRTDERLEELAAAQKRTEERVEELAQAQKRTEEALLKLTQRVENIEERLDGISNSVGYSLENAAFKALPKLLHDRYGIVVQGKLLRRYVGDRQVNIWGRGRRNGREVVIVGESKVRPSRKEVDRFLKIARRLAIQEGWGEVVHVFVAHDIPPPVEHYLEEKGILAFWSYDF
ncbi:coiled-coil domain-containing protein [Desulfosoma caldarium]|uniref:Chordopoxvirus fusion protein n=1 Tax=Desulfosoma caldarium TaxID=610254 RepID=A0A3N1VFP8_9BACT|nr:hypothetical protein [Desulfosoma caldarium]ROR01676.1 hypothetical protein EDC27_0858 [Desulfosoma caldarium]